MKRKQEMKPLVVDDRRLQIAKANKNLVEALEMVKRGEFTTVDEVPWKCPPLPPGWIIEEVLENGCVARNRNAGLLVIASAAIELDGKPWLHVSFSHRQVIPSRATVQIVKDLFIGQDRYAYEVWPPASLHVNIHPFCLHLYSPLGENPVPDFTRGNRQI